VVSDLDFPANLLIISGNISNIPSRIVMDFRIHAPLILTLGLVLGACEPYPPAGDPYGSGAAQAPRYGHEGTNSPRNPNYKWEQQQAQQRQAAQNAAANADASAQTNPDGTPGVENPEDPTRTVDDRGNRNTGANKREGSGNTASKPSSGGGKMKFGTPVPGKPGFLYSPHNPDGGYIDIRVENSDGTMGTLPPGTKIKDPFSIEPILVP
jgi:hypothetical protein